VITLRRYCPALEDPALYYLYPTPPYFLLAAGLLAGLLSGLAFSATLKATVRSWSGNEDAPGLAQATLGLPLQVPYLGIMGGICVFLGSGVQIFGVSAKVAYIIAIALTIFTAQLVWKQLGSILTQIEEQGFSALDLEDMF